jgi:membrane-associated phospholipid phosphatase
MIGSPREISFACVGANISMLTPENPNFSRVLAAIAVMMIAVAAIMAAFQFDAKTRDYVVAMQGKGWKKSATFKISTAARRYGDWPQLMIIGAIGIGAASLARSREWRRILITAMVASTLAGILANSMRLTTGRARPREAPKLAGWYGPFHEGKLTIGQPKYNSFPSGHTTTAVGFAGVILFARPLVGVLAMAIALGIAWSRVLLGDHHLSDITVASLLALLVAWFCWRESRRSGDAIAAWFVRKFSRKR